METIEEYKSYLGVIERAYGPHVASAVLDSDMAKKPENLLGYLHETFGLEYVRSIFGLNEAAKKTEQTLKLNRR